MSAVDPTANPAAADSASMAAWDELTPNQISARNPSEAQQAARFPPGVSGNPSGRAKTRIDANAILEDFLLEEREESEHTRIVNSMRKYADNIENCDLDWMKLWLARSMPVINKLQAEVLHAEVRVAPELPNTDEHRKAVAEALDADYEVVDEGEE